MLARYSFRSENVNNSVFIECTYTIDSLMFVGINNVYVFEIKPCLRELIFVVIAQVLSGI